MAELKVMPTKARPGHQHTCPGCGVNTSGVVTTLQTPDKDPYGNLIAGRENKPTQCCSFHSYQCWLGYRKERGLDD